MSRNKLPQIAAMTEVSHTLVTDMAEEWIIKVLDKVTGWLIWKRWVNGGRRAIAAGK
jgi:hypothetical protein